MSMDIGGPYMSERLEIQQLRRNWELLWGKQPHKLIGRVSHKGEIHDGL